MVIETDIKIPLYKGCFLAHQDAGIDTEQALKRAKQSLAVLENEWTLMDAETFSAYWNAMEEQCTSDDLPLKLGSSLSFETFHPFVFAVLCSPNVKTALSRLSKHAKLGGPICIITEKRKESMTLEYYWEPHAAKHLPNNYLILLIVAITKVIRLATREFITPLAVECNQTLATTAAYEAFLGASIQTGTKCAVSFSMEDILKPCVTQNNRVWHTLAPEYQCHLKEHAKNVTMTERVRSALSEYLPKGLFTAEQIASRLNISTRSMQRHLKSENTSFKRISLDVRKQLAIHYVTSTDSSYSEIAHILGYSDKTSFYRAFRQWENVTPNEMRKNILEHAAE